MSNTMTNAARLTSRGPIRKVATVIVATDGTEQSDGALRVALARARETGASLEVVTVAMADPIADPEMQFSTSGEPNLPSREELREAVETQLTRVNGHESTHSVTLFEGNPAHVIARIATERRAALIVVGLGRHLVMDRLFSNETALQLARISRVPVLAVPSAARQAPRHAVVAVDFGELSIRVAQTAIEVVGDGGRVELVHVMQHAYDAFSIESKEVYDQWVHEQLTALSQQLVVPSGVEVSFLALRGRPAPELLAYAEKVGADLIATGTQGRGFVARTLIGSVTSQLIRAATCSLLTIPRAALLALTRAERHALGMSTGAGPGEWARMLADFTTRNLGRRTILEVDDLEIGAQAQEVNYPLVAVMYDLRAQRLQIMLGDQTASGRHLSRSISGVSGIDVLADGRGHDVTLRIAHGTSQTLLTFAP